MCRDKAVASQLQPVTLLSGKIVRESDVRGKLAPCPRDIFSLMLTWRDVLTFSLPVSYHEAQQSGLNLTPCIGRNVLCGRLPAFIRTVLSACELCCWLLREFIKIGGERQCSCLNLIYSISVPHMEYVCSDGCYLWNCRRKKS